MLPGTMRCIIAGLCVVMAAMSAASPLPSESTRYLQEKSRNQTQHVLPQVQEYRLDRVFYFSHRPGYRDNFSGQSYIENVHTRIDRKLKNNKHLSEKNYKSKNKTLLINTTTKLPQFDVHNVNLTSNRNSSELNYKTYYRKLPEISSKTENTRHKSLNNDVGKESKNSLSKTSKYKYPDGKKPFRIKLEGSSAHSVSNTQKQRKKETGVAENKQSLEVATSKHKKTTIKDKSKSENYKYNTIAPLTIKLTKSPTRRRTTINKHATNKVVVQEKQGWYENGVPIPQPNPEIISNGPEYPIAAADDFSEISAIGVDAVEQEPALGGEQPLSTFNLEMLPAPGGQSPCPTVHISSAVLSAASGATGGRQAPECSDLNLVINSHYHQNMVTRSPELEQLEDSPGGGGIQQDQLGSPQQGDPIGGAPGAVQQAPAAGGTGGSGGSGGQGGDGGDGGGNVIPDLTRLFQAVEYLWNKFGNLFTWVKNPNLFRVPMALAFGIGFLSRFLAFPWWIPGAILYSELKSKKHIVHHEHKHKPVHHSDGWFWNHDTKSWENVLDYTHRKRPLPLPPNRRTNITNAIITSSRRRYRNHARGTNQDSPYMIS